MERVQSTSMSPHSLVRPAKILLTAADGYTKWEISMQFEVTPPAVTQSRSGLSRRSLPALHRSVQPSQAPLRTDAATPDSLVQKSSSSIENYFEAGRPEGLHTFLRLNFGRLIARPRSSHSTIPPRDILRGALPRGRVHRYSTHFRHGAKMQPAVPFFSVIVPTHKRPVLLERALKSIKSQESPLPYQIIVVADEANPADDEVCHRLLGPDDIHVRRNGPPGPSLSRNLGIDLASGRYILFLDDDDAWQPGFLAQLANQPAIRENRLVYFDCVIASESRAEFPPRLISEAPLDLSQRLNELVYVRNQLPNSGLAIPRRLIGDVRFDPHMRAYEDWDFLLALCNREMPQHVPLRGVTIFQAKDDSTDHRGKSHGARDLNALLDYLYVYHRHPAPNAAVRQYRVDFLQQMGIAVAADLL
jgi:GalNAc5-diNAcBac-PP-undecaprenol beta-1,3-glucosyltransferase